MSVLNRKMFKPRNARNALNKAAGIPAVASFQTGGSTNPLTRRRTLGTTTGLSGLPGIYTAPKFTGPLARANVGELAQRYISGKPLTASEFSVLRGAEQGFLSGQGLNQSMGQFGKTRLGSGIRSILNPMAQAGGNIRGFLEGATGTAAKTLLGSSDGSMPADKAAGPQLNKDYLESLGINFLDPTNLQTASSRGGPVPPSAFGKAVPPPAAPKSQEELDADAKRAEELNREEAIARAEMDRIGSVVGNEEAGLSPTGFLPTTTPSLESATDNAARAAELAARKDDDDTREEGGGFSKADEDQELVFSGQSGDGTGTDDKKKKADGVDGDAPSAKKEIDRVINSGTKEEQQDQLKQLMAEFTENVPEYKGIDKGLAMAKIGFAMAAGKSPNAIENIANALEQGADMLIKDQSKKDEFNRQVQLSALQYGLKDIAAERQLKRAAEFQTSDYVLMPGQKYTYPDGRTITGGEGGTTISLRKSDILENGLPDGVQGTSMASALITKKATLTAAVEKARLAGIKSRTLDTPKKITEYVDDYDASVTDVINSNNAIHLTKQVMIANAEGEITGFQPGFNSMLAKAMTLAGVDATKYTDRDLAIADLRKVFQKLVPLTLGKDQSANSISDKDVNRLADAYMSDAILGGGIMGLMTTPANVLDSKLGGVLVEFENAQKSALDRLNSLEATGAEFLTPSGSALGTRVSGQRKRLQAFLPQGSRSMLTVGDDGIYRRIS